MLAPEFYFIVDGKEIKINGIYEINDDLLKLMFNFDDEDNLMLVEKAFRKEILYIKIVLLHRNTYVYGLAEFEDNMCFYNETHYGSMYIHLSPNKKDFIY